MCSMRKSSIISGKPSTIVHTTYSIFFKSIYRIKHIESSSVCDLIYQLTSIILFRYFLVYLRLEWQAVYISMFLTLVCTNTGTILALFMTCL